jgi:hypothetical protein
MPKMIDKNTQLDAQITICQPLLMANYELSYAALLNSSLLQYSADHTRYLISAPDT